MSPEDIKRRGGAKYNPDDDNLSNWVKLGYLCFNPRFNKYLGVELGEERRAEKILREKDGKNARIFALGAKNSRG